jgi:hypothetical protein
MSIEESEWKYEEKRKRKKRKWKMKRRQNKENGKIDETKERKGKGDE